MSSSGNGAALPGGSPLGCLGFLLDGLKPARGRQWGLVATPVLAQAAIGAGHWRAGRQRRAAAAWAMAAGAALTVWGLGTEAPEAPEVVPNRRNRRSGWMETAAVMAEVVSVPWGLRHPRRLSVPAAVFGAWSAIFPAARAVRGAQKRRPRMAIGGALAALGGLARLWAVSAEPLA
ncbi:MAG: hypothetical protein ACRD0J_14225 [Acidimicrobiales bacterium]